MSTIEEKFKYFLIKTLEKLTERLEKLTAAENNTELLNAKLISMGGHGCRNNIRIQG